MAGPNREFVGKAGYEAVRRIVVPETPLQVTAIAVLDSTSASFKITDLGPSFAPGICHVEGEAARHLFVSANLEGVVIGIGSAFQPFNISRAGSRRRHTPILAKIWERDDWRGSRSY